MRKINLLLERVAAAIGFIGWTSTAHAHGEEAVWLGIGILFVILMIPFAAFLFFWRNSRNNKIILCLAYLLAFPVACFAALSANFSSVWIFFIVLFGIPLGVWLLGVLWLREAS
jgi:phosphate/sulfate permease